ncbi:MAG: ATP-binding protein [Bacillota bacterium]
MFKLWSRGFRFQMIAIVSVLLLVPVMMMIYDMLIISKTDDELIANLEKKLAGVVQSMSKQIHDQLAAHLEGEPGRNLPSALERSFQDIAKTKAENYKGVRLGIYIVEQERILIEGFLHDYRPPGGEGKQQREHRIYLETSAGIRAVVTGGIPITKLGQTWDDHFIEHLVPIYFDSKLVAVVWAEERVHPIFAQSAKARRIIRLVTLIVFSFGVGATLLSTISLIRQVRNIKNGLLKMEKNFSNTLPDMPGEMGQVTKAINKMASSLKEKEQLAEQLRASQNMASLGRLVTDIAHELRNPICIIQCTVDLIEPKVNHSPDLKECIFMLQDQLNRIRMLTEELLDFGRPLPLKMENLDLRDLLGSLLDTTGPLLQKNQIALHFFNPEQLPNIIGNKEKLAQVFVNLIINAIQAMPKGGALTIETLTKEEHVCVIVSDTGEGISEEDLPKIFQPFFTKKVGGGGLGLAISKKIIENHGGSIAVESQPGAVTRFTVCFPIN